MSVLPQIEGGYLVNQGMLLEVDDVNFDVVQIEGGRRQKKKYNYELFQPKVLPTLDLKQKQKRKLRTQSHDNASTGSDEDHQKDAQSKKRKDAARSRSLAAVERPNRLSEESRSVFAKYASVAPTQKRKRSDQSKSSESDSQGAPRVHFDDHTIESYPEEDVKEAKPSPRPLPGYLKPTRSFGNKAKEETEAKMLERYTEFRNGITGNGETDGAEAIQRRPYPSRLKAITNDVSHQERVRAERRRARIWRETASDPGNTEKSIQNDQVIKGRVSQNRRKQPIINRHEDRPKGADRGRRNQSLPSRKDAHDSETVDRPVNSAPSKEQPKQEGPIPKVNTLVSTPLQVDKESSRTVPKEKEEVIESKPKEKTSPATNEESVSKKSLVIEEKPKLPVKKPGGESGEGTPAPSEEKKSSLKLPPDDHGPVNAPVEKESPPQPSPTKNVDFQYYASAKPPESNRKKSEDSEKDKPSPVQLRLQSEKSIKMDSERRARKDVSPSKTPGRGRDVSPGKSPGRGRDLTPSKSPGRGRDFSPSKSPRRDFSPGKYLRKMEKAKTMTERTEPSEFSDASYKKREVTIMDPKDVRNELDMEEGTDFPGEYEMGYHRRSKTFEEMTDEEKISYFKNELKLRPEQIRELTFHPRTTAPKQIHRAYTGMDTVNWRQKSARLKSPRRAKSRNAMVYRKVSVVPPSQRKSYMLSKLQGVVYRHINKVYGTSSKNMREKQFFERLAELQLKEYQKRYEKLEDNERRQLEMKYKQREQLRHLRKKFEDDAWRRFMTQYVTSKVMESEYRDRSEYGLPNNLPRTQASGKRRHIYTMTPKSRYRSNRKKYANLFNFNTGPQVKQGGKPLKFEGFDAIYIDTEDENGSPTKKRQDVQALMEEAFDLLQAHDDDIDLDEPSGRRPLRKQSEPAMRRHDRPHHSFKRYSDGRTLKAYSEGRPFKPYMERNSIKGGSQRSRLKPRQKPKTMKDLIGKRNQGPANRYKASEFNTMKQNLLRDSEKLNRNHRDREQKSSHSKPDTTEQKEKGDGSTISKQSERHRPPPDIQPVKPPAAVKKTGSMTQSSTWRVENGNVHLHDPETQMGIDSEREQIVNKGTNGQPAKTTTSTTKTVTTVTTTTTKKSRSPEKKPGDTESVSETTSIKQDGRSSVISQKLHPAVSRKPISRTPSMATVRETDNTPPTTKPIQRTASRASIMSVSQRHRPGISQPRAPSRVSVTGDDKKNIVVNGTGRTSRVSAVVPSEPTKNGRVSRTSAIAPPEQASNGRTPETNTEVQSKQTTSPDRRRASTTSAVVPSEQITRTVTTKEEVKEIVSDENGVINVADANAKVEEPLVNGHISNGSGGSPVTVALGESNGRVSPIVSVSASNKEPEKTASRRPSIRSNQISIDQQRQSRLSPSPSIRSRTVNGRSPMRTQSKETKSPSEAQVNGDSKPITGSTVDVKRSEHMSEVVREVVEKQRKDRSPVKSDASKQSRNLSEDKTSTTRGRSVTGRESKAGSNDDRKASVMSQVKDANLVNGHGDTKMKREDYERQGQERTRTRTRSRSRDKKGRKRSTSRGRDRKRSTSREKKRGKGKAAGKTRFPDIEQRPNSIARTSPTSDKNKTHVSVSRKEKVEETEREVTPKGGADQWRDLVQKYMRQPSPKIGKAETRALLDASFDTDDDDDDIFARAQKRYALSISDADTDAD